MRSYRPITSKEATEKLCAEVDTYGDPIQPERFYVACRFSSPGNGTEEDLVASGPFSSLPVARLEADSRNRRAED